MQFQLLPVTDLMIDLYSKPRTTERFQQYLEILQGGTKGDMVMPVGSFNPMAKEHAIHKLHELKALNAEKLMQEALENLNKKISGENKNIIFKVAFNLADDLKGGWTNRFTTGYDSKFKINALLNRNFCVSLFWTSETFSPELIKKRTLQYAYRTIYRLSNPSPKTLQEHTEQERFVSKNTSDPVGEIKDPHFKQMDAFYKENLHTDNYHIIFNFFYGDEASASLSFPCFGVSGQLDGFRYAACTL